MGSVSSGRTRFTVKYKPEQGVLGRNGLGHLKGRERARMQVRIRDNFTCQDCGLRRTHREVTRYNKKVSGLKGKMKNLDVHHTGGMCGKNSRGYDRVEDIEGMTTLCHRCHYNRPEHRVKKWEAETLQRKEKQFIETVAPKIDILLEAGMSVKDIAYNLGISSGRINKYIDSK